MSDGRFPPESLRAFVEGRLSRGEAAELRAAASADPGVAAAIEAMATAFVLTEEPPLPPRRSAVSLAAMEALLDAAEATPAPRARRLPRIAWPLAAAALLAATFAIAGPLLARAARRGPAELALAFLGGAAPAAAAPAPVPGSLAGFDPEADGAVRWITDLEEGRAVARLAGRPLLLYVFHPSCPLCVALGRTTFRDEGVRAAVRRWVPVRIDVTAPEAAPLDPAALFRRGWPYMAEEDGTGRRVREFPGFHDADAMRDLLAGDGDEDAAPPPPWDAIRAAAARLRRADALLAEGRPGAAWAELVAVDGTAGAALVAAADARRAAIASRAREALEAARALAVTDAAAASRALAEAARSFEGSPAAGEFAVVRAALDAAGRFPAVIPPRVPEGDPAPSPGR